MFTSLRTWSGPLAMSVLLIAGLNWCWQSLTVDGEEQPVAKASPDSASDQRDLHRREIASSIATPAIAADTAESAVVAPKIMASDRGGLRGNPFSVTSGAVADAPPPVADAIPETPVVSVLDSLPLRSPDQRTSFAELMADVALDDRTDEAVGFATIELSFSPLVGTRPVPWPVDLGQFDRIFAHVMTGSDCKPCFVKWQHAASGDIQRLATVSLEANRWETIYLTPDTGWGTGSYVFSVLDATPDRRLLARSSIRVSAVREGAYPLGPDTEYVQALLNTGQAAAKSGLYIDIAANQKQSLPDYALIQNLVDGGRAVMKTAQQ